MVKHIIFNYAATNELRMRCGRLDVGDSNKLSIDVINRGHFNLRYIKEYIPIDSLDTVSNESIGINVLYIYDYRMEVSTLLSGHNLWLKPIV